MLSNEELRRNIQSLEAKRAREENSGQEAASATVEDTQGSRLELEMQSRALRELQAELEIAVQRYQDLYDRLPIGYVTLTRQGKILEANLTAAGWLRRNQRQLSGTYMNWFLDAFDAGRFAAHLEACVQTGAEQVLDGVTLRLENGLQLTVQFASRLAPIFSDREPQVHTALMNISRLRQAQTVVEDIEREQKAFSHSIAHDLHEPLATISKFSHAVLTEHAATLTPEVRSMVERMECAAVRTEGALHQLLEYCSLGQEEIALDPVNLDEVVQQVIVEHRGAIARRAAEIEVDRPLPCVRGARLMLAQVLASVLTNILKHSLSGEAPRLRVTSESHDAFAVLKIRDQGPAAGEPEQNFRVIERVNGCDSFLGNSVGLAIISRAIERMSGRVWVDSSIELGNCFNIELPKV